MAVVQPLWLFVHNNVIIVSVHLEPERFVAVAAMTIIIHGTINAAHPTKQFELILKRQ